MTIFVGNLPYTAKYKEVESLFNSPCHVRIIIDRETGQSKGFGFVDFASKEIADAEINRLQDSNVMLGGRQVRFGEAVQKPRTSRQNDNGPRANNASSRNYRDSKPRSREHRPQRRENYEVNGNY